MSCNQLHFISRPLRMTRRRRDLQRLQRAAHFLLRRRSAADRNFPENTGSSLEGGPPAFRLCKERLFYPESSQLDTSCFYSSAAAMSQCRAGHFSLSSNFAQNRSILKRQPQRSPQIEWHVKGAFLIDDNGRRISSTSGKSNQLCSLSSAKGPVTDLVN